MSGGGKAWEEGEGRGQSQTTPAAPDRTRNSSTTEEAGETEKERDTETELHTAREGRGLTHTGMEPPIHMQWAGSSNSTNGAHLHNFLCPCFCSNHFCLQPVTLQSPNCPLFPAEFEEGLLDRCPAPGPHPALVEGRRSSVKVEAEASRQ